jgi:hypothetical protein
LTEGTDDSGPSFSPDGSHIIYKTYVHGNPAIFRLDLTAGKLEQLTGKISGRPQFSPDGTRILCSYRPQSLGPAKLSILPAAGGEPEIVFGFTTGLFRWTENGQAILFVDQFADGGMNIRRQAIDPAIPPAKITSWTSDRIYGFDISGDGKTIACARGTSESDVVLITADPAVK